MTTRRETRALARRSRKPGEPLKDPAPAKPIPGARGVGQPTAGTESSGGGIVSPLTEIARGSTMLQITSSDGFFVFEFPKSVTYEDAVGTEIEFIRDP